MSNLNYTPYLEQTGKLWGVFCEDYVENWMVITVLHCTDVKMRTKGFDYTIYATAYAIHLTFCMPWSLLISYYEAHSDTFWHTCYLGALILAQFWSNFLTLILVKQHLYKKRTFQHKWKHINSLWSNIAIWRYGLILAEVMACCLMEQAATWTVVYQVFIYLQGSAIFMWGLLHNKYVISQ